LQSSQTFNKKSPDVASTIADPYDLPFSHNTSVTDGRTDDTSCHRRCTAWL